MTKQRLELGRRGEELAADFLKQKGFRIIQRNYRSRMGEIDIVAKDKGTFCFIEVKTRNSLDFGLPQEAISSAKRRQISKAALGFLKEKGLLQEKARFDVVSVLFQQDSPRVDLITDAFTLDASFSY